MSRSLPATFPTLGVLLGGGLLALLCGLLAACGAEAGGGGARPEAGRKQDLSPEERQRREQKARALYGSAQGQPPGEKVATLSDLAQVYHDTEIAPQAFLDLVFYLSDHSVDRPDEALAALESFEQRRPDAPQVMPAANVLYSVATRKKDAAEDDETRARFATMADRALAIYVAAADRMIDAPVVKDDPGAIYEIGNAYLLAGRHADAEKAWARVETFEKPAEDTRRFDFLIRRAELLRGPLGRRREALDLFLEARKLQEGLGRASSRELRDYVDQAIEELRG